MLSSPLRAGVELQIIKMAGSKEERHRYGQHYTPSEVARLLAALAIRSSTDLVLDPSCGDGRLLKEAIRLKAYLSRHGKPTPDYAREVFGIDRSASAVRLASLTGADVTVADFFDTGSGQGLRKSLELPGQFDAIIGNPPYIRQEVMGARDKRRIEKRMQSDRALATDLFWPRWSGRSDIYVYFFAHSAQLLKAGGRLAFLTASSWLDVGYGAPLREFLLKNFRLIAVIESARESFFTDASINTSITVLAREPNQRARDLNCVRFVQLTCPLGDLLKGDQKAGPSLELSRAIERADSSFGKNAFRVRVIKQEDLLRDLAQSSERTQSSAGWGKYLRADNVFFQIVERGGARLRRLSELALVRFGVKTGANEFFYVKEAVADKAKGGLLALSDVASVRRGLMTGANEFFYLKLVAGGSLNSQDPDRARLVDVEDRRGFRFAIEARYLAPVVFSLKEISGIALDRIESGRLFFNCQVVRADLAGTNALRHIRRGERAGYHIRPSCASRELWYRVAHALKPAPLIFPSKVGERWLVALNRARVFEDKKLYGIFPRASVSPLLLAAMLNSTWARYYAELTCRQMTGAQAIADIDVAVAERLMIPDPRKLPSAIKQGLRSALISLARRPVYSIFEEIKRADRRRLDELTLRAIGFTNAAERELVLDQLYSAVSSLVEARLKKRSGQNQ